MGRPTGEQLDQAGFAVASDDEVRPELAADQLGCDGGSGAPDHDQRSPHSARACDLDKRGDLRRNWTPVSDWSHRLR